MLSSDHGKMSVRERLKYLHVPKKELIINIINADKSRGRLAQWKNIRLPIQGSVFEPARSFLCAINLHYRYDIDSSTNLVRTRHLTVEKADLNSLLHEREHSPTNWSYDVT